MNEQNTTETPEKKNGWKEKTLKAAGYSYLVGDALMIGAGRARGNKSTISGAATWLMGGLAAARYGNPSQQRQQRMIATDLADYFSKQGVSISDDVRAQIPLFARQGMVQRAENFLYAHPSEGLNAMYGIGAAMLLRDGIKDVQKMGRSAVVPKAFNAKGILGVSSNLWMGITIVLGAIAGIFIKEDPEAKQKAQNGNIFSRIWAAIKEKPLRLSATLYAINNVFLGLTAYQDFQARGEAKYTNKSKPHWFSIPQLCVYLFANTMLLLSRRDQMQKGGLPEAMLAPIEDAAAQVIAAQAPEKQHALLADVSAYLAQQKGIARKPEEIAAELGQRVANIAAVKNPAAPAAEVPRAVWAEREDTRRAEVPSADMASMAVR